MYKLTILFFFLTAFNSQSLTDSYQLKFVNENATYILQIKEGNLVMENQPDVTVTAIVESNSSINTDKKTNKIYKITKGATFEEGLKIGAEDEIITKEIGEEDEITTKEIGGEDEINTGGREMNLLFGTKDHQAYEIVLSYALVTVVEKSNNEKTIFPIADGAYLIIADGKFALFR